MIVGLKGKVPKDIRVTDQSKTLPRDLWLSAKVLQTIMHATSAPDDRPIGSVEHQNYRNVSPGW